MKTLILRALTLLSLLALNACPGGRTDIVCGGAGAFICPGGFYCHLGSNCGGLDHEGLCMPLPHECEPKDEPVCSCAGKNYQNACYANAAADNVAYRGACMNSPVIKEE